MLPKLWCRKNNVMGWRTSLKVSNLNEWNVWRLAGKWAKFVVQLRSIVCGVWVFFYILFQFLKRIVLFLVWRLLSRICWYYRTKVLLFIYWFQHIFIFRWIGNENLDLLLSSFLVEALNCQFVSFSWNLACRKR